MWFDDLVYPFIPILAKLIFSLVSIMAGSVVISGQGWGKIRGKNKFAKFWSLFLYFIIEVLVWVLISDSLIAYVQGLLYRNIGFTTGITTAVLGAFFYWFVYTLDYDIKTQWKWVLPVVCIGITILNLLALRT